MRTKTTYARAALLGLLLAGLPARPAAAGGLDLRGWVDRPGVRLVAVEFYATWCQPCMAAVPRWKALHERYRGQGLRLVVVATQDPEGQCGNPGWNPDEVICDPEGNVARAFGVGDRLPAAFLWSWQGNLLVRRGHVEAVEAAVASYLRDLPRVGVDVAGGADAALGALVRDRVVDSGKLAVVATEEERAALRELRRRSAGKGFDERLTCEPGQEMPANSLLRVSVSEGAGARRLHLQLFSAATSCLLTSATAPYVAERASQAVAEAVDRLLGRLRAGLQMPAGRRPDRGAVPGKVAEGRIGETRPEWQPEAGQRRTVVRFTSEPAGAVVLLDGELLCQATPCSREVAAGRARVSMQKERYGARADWVELARGAAVHWALTPDFGWLTVTSEPSGLPVRVDGEEAGRTPVARRELPPGAYEVLVTSPCHYDEGERINLGRGEERTVAVRLAAKEGAIDVSARDGAGDAVAATVRVDGVRVGETPGVFRVPACAKEVAVEHPVAGAWRQPLAVGERETMKLEAALPGRAGLAAVAEPPVAEPPEGGGGRSAVPFVLAGTAAAGAVVAVVVALAAKQAADDAYGRYEQDAGRTPQWYADEVLPNARAAVGAQWAAVGLGALAGGLALWGWSW